MEIRRGKNFNHFIIITIVKREITANAEEDIEIEVDDRAI
jgi:hypothetical protein